MDGCVCKEEEEEKGWREGRREVRDEGRKDGWRKRRQERGRRRDGRKILHTTFTIDAGKTSLRSMHNIISISSSL